MDSVYYGYAEVNTEYSGATYDPDYANQLLDDMGMKDIDGDGYRETPAGLKFQWSIYNTGEATDLVPVSELLVAYWSEIGLHCDVQTIDATLLGLSLIHIFRRRGPNSRPGPGTVQHHYPLRTAHP